MKTRIGDCLCGKPERVVEEDGEQVMIRCPHYIKVVGANPQTGEQVEEWRCAVDWVPMLLIEIAQAVRGAQAATESFRNEVVKRADAPRLERVPARPPVQTLEAVPDAEE